jgi:gas vesicle protein
MGTFKKGIFFGGLLGAGLMWLNTTKRGKELRNAMLDHAAEVYEEVKTKITKSKSWKKLSKNEYVRMVEDAVNTYAVEHNLPDSMRDMVEKIVKAQWKKIKGES